MLDLRRLQILRAVAREGSLAGAARTLSYSTPAVWQQMQRLEAEVGASLIVRHARGVRLTPAGASLVEHAGALLARAEAAEADLRRLDGAQLRVAAFASAAAGLVAPAIGRLAEQAPHADVRLDDLEPDAALARVRSGAADLAVIYAYDDAPPRHDDLVLRPLLDEPLAVVLPAGHPLADDAHVPAGRLRGERLLRGRQGPAALPADGGAAVRYRGEGFDVVKRLVAAGAGVAVVPGLALDPLPAGVVARPTTGRRRLYAALADEPAGLRAILLDALAAVAAEWAGAPLEVAS